MTKEIEKFDPSKLMDGVKDRIKSTFVSLIPDEMWNAMVEKEIYIFTTGKIEVHHDYDYTTKTYKDWEERIPYPDKDIKNEWGSTTQKAEVSPLRQMIRDELHKKFEQDLNEWLKGEEYQSAFTKYGAPEISKAVESILVKNADTIFFNFMSRMMQQGFDSMKAGLGLTQQIGNYNY